MGEAVKKSIVFLMGEGLKLKLSKNSEFKGRLNKIFLKICDNNFENFNFIVSKISKKNKENIDWWVSNPASRNTLNSDLYIDFCKIQMVKDLLNSGEVIDQIIIDSKLMKDTLEQINFSSKTKIIFDNRKRIFTIKKILGRFIIPIQEFIIRGYQLFLFKLIFNKKIKIPHQELILIDTYAFPGYYSKDRYYNGLLSVLNKKEKEKIYFIPTIVNTKWYKIFSAFNELFKANRQFLFKEGYLKISDIFYAILYPFRIYFLKIGMVKLDGIDYSSLVYKDLYQTNSYRLAIEGLINYRFIKRLKQNKVKIHRIIDWWESQAMDKGLHKALSDFLPEVSAIGYLGYVPRKLELQLYPTKYELDCGVVPKNIKVIGKGFINTLKKFNKEHKIGFTSAFRFKHLWDHTAHVPDKNQYTILIALPITIDNAIHIIDQVLLGVKNHTVNPLWKFWVKPHPAVLVEEIKNKINNKWLKIFEFIDIETQFALRRANVLISGMSSICLEAMALGIPVLIVNQKQGIKFNPIPDNLVQGLWRECNSGEDIINGIEFYKNRNELELTRHQYLGSRIRETHFEPISRKKVIEFLDLKMES